MKNLFKTVFISLICVCFTTASNSQWRSVSNGVKTYRNILHNDGNRLFSGASDGLLTSFNSGKKWEKLNHPDDNVRAVLTLDNLVFTGGSKRIYKSTDFGMSFTDVLSNFMGFYDVKSFSDKIYATTGSNYLYVSSNEGSTWQQLNVNNSNCLKLLPVNNILFAACLGALYQDNGGVYKSTDEGQSWMQTPLYNINVKNIASNSNYIFATSDFNLYRSSDNGLTWNTVTIPAVGVTIYSISVLEDKLVISVGGNNYYSPDNGNTFLPYNLTGNMMSLVKKENRLIASVESRGIYLSDDLGNTWDYYLHEDIPINTFYKRGGRLFAGTDQKGLFISDDQGENWKRASLNSGTVEGLTSNQEYLVAGTDNSGVYRSSDNGDSWSFLNLTETVNAVHYHNEKLFAARAYYNIMRSSDHGMTWNVNSFSGSVGYTFADWKGILFAGFFSSGIHFSTTGGDSWTATSLTNASIKKFDGNENYFFAATLSQPGIFRSSDNGLTWESTGLNNPCWSVAVSGKTVIAGSGLYGVFVSTDNGNSWQNRNYNIPDGNIHAVLIEDDNVYAGTWENSIYKIPISDLTSAGIVSTQVPEDFKLNQNYPNPFNPSTVITFNVPYKSDIRIRLYNILGTEIRTLVNDSRSAGQYKINFDGSSLSSGIYFYSFEVNGKILDTKRMALVK